MSTLANKTIYMTYKKPIPPLVLDRWKALNPEYRIDFSLDADCIAFLTRYFGPYFANLFVQIPRGMYKADLWRLCKLYISGGVYADVDLVPYVSIDSLLNGSTFQTCMALDNTSVFQAFMIVTKPRHPLVLQFLISFLHHRPYTYPLGPTLDMYNCLKYNTGSMVSETRYDLEEIRIPILIGSSQTNTKVVPLYYFPDIDYELCLVDSPVSEQLIVAIEGSNMIVNSLNGWDYPQYCEIVIKSKESFFLFKEVNNGPHWSTSYVTYKGQKILDSRDPVYYAQGGW
jgi:hypothetical protein